LEARSRGSSVVTPQLEAIVDGQIRCPRGQVLTVPGRLILRATEEGTAAGIYGIIVSAAVMSTSHAHSAAATAAAVLIALVVYWSAAR
jgi:hypothetical protein